MNREDIIRMAREVGFEQAGHLSFQEITHRLENFAALVASAEREACAKVCEDLWRDSYTAYACAEAIRARSIDVSP